MTRTILDYAACSIILCQTAPPANSLSTPFRISLLNRLAEELTGYSTTELQGQPLDHLLTFPAPDWTDVGPTAPVDGWITLRDGNRMKQSVRLVPTPDGIAITLLSQPTTENRVSLLEGIAAHSPNGLVVYQAVRAADGTIDDYRTLFYNPKALEITGLTESELQQQTLFERQPDGKRFADTFRQVVETGHEWNWEYFNPRLGRWFEVFNRPLGDGFFTSFRDITQLVEARQQIQQQHDLLDGVLNASIAGIAVCQAVHDPNGDLPDFRVVLTNEIALRLAEKNRAEVVGKTITQIYPQTKKTGMWPFYGAVYQTGQPVRAEQFNPELARWFDVAINKLGDGLVITFLDITVRKASELEAQQTSELMQNILQSVPTGIVLYQALRADDGRITDFVIRQVNQMASSLIGLQPDYLIGQPMLAVLPSYQELGLFDQALELMETGEARRSEIQYTRDGLDHWLDISGVKHEDGLLVSFLDSTDRKKAELNRLEQATFLDQLLQTSPYAIIAYQAVRAPGQAGKPGPIINLKTVFHNAAYETVFAVTADDVYNRTFQERLTEEQNPGLLKRYIELIETGHPLRREHFYPHLNKWLDVSITRLGDGLLAVMLDITDRKKVEDEKQQQARQLEILNQELQRSNQSLEQFAYVASHDLREPLRKIQAFGNLLTDQYGPVLGTDGADWLRRMQDAASRMADLIQDLLAYSRLTGRQEPFVRVDLNSLLKDILSDLEMVVREKHAQITVDPLPHLTGSPLQLRQLFQNLLSNALKFSKSDEPPRVTIQAVSPEEWESSLPEQTTPATWAALRITDNGIGFDERHSQRIFELFQRLHGRAQYPGTGIGLAIARKVVDNHGGLVHVRSRPNHGTMFTIYLPLSPKPKVV
ncbi:PAS domain-containing protein [Larkinella sp. VNQ87]|uniref:PAS domain-containing sensor histidine kinase n=1 Tax=Larkinella sp. VNQ87 TaxID=3400921 RepID=UPI003C12A49E